MKGGADLVFPCESADDIFQALRPELEDEPQRSRVSLILGQGFIRLRIEGGDIVSIRAALNTWLRLVKIAFEMANI
ncbi:Transcription factor Pcc1 [uncultured archaeon]|nr:Transcription factor Pcc1 [uncultured archaeon]